MHWKDARHKCRAVAQTNGDGTSQGGGDTSEAFAALLAAALAKPAVVPTPPPGGALRGVGRQVTPAKGYNNRAHVQSRE
jgi:sugar (pentulose or hexulose) kinase